MRTWPLWTEDIGPAEKWYCRCRDRHGYTVLRGEQQRRCLRCGEIAPWVIGMPLKGVEMDEREKNLRNEIRKFPGKFVAVSKQHVVASADTAAGLLQTIGELEIDPDVIFQVGGEAISAVADVVGDIASS